MKLAGVVIALLFATAAHASGSDADSLRGDNPSGTVRREPPRPVHPEGLRLSMNGYMNDTLLRDGFVTPTPGYLTVAFDMRPPAWYSPATRFEAVANAAGAAAALGLFAGALGTTLGWFDEDTSWALTAGLAAIGATYGAARYEAPPPKIRVNATAHRQE